VRNTGEIFKLIENINKNIKNINSYTPIYPDTDIGIENIEFFEKYKISAECAGRETVTDKKNFLVRNLLVSAESGFAYRNQMF
jgi:hypothetical protein